MADVLSPLPISELPTGIGSNGPRVEPQILRWLRSTPRDTPIEEMKTRLSEDGYVFVKGLLPRDDVLQAREA